VSADFREALLGYFSDIEKRVVTDRGEWTVKGFIDVYQRVYSISLDTKVLSKVLEMLMFPVILQFAQDYDYELTSAAAQNHYPDFTLTAKQDPSRCYALDIKTTYRTGTDANGQMRVNGMTLGTFGGYFRNRERALSSTLAYNRYQQHYVLGAVYSRIDNITDGQVYTIAQLADIPSVATDFVFFLHEKYQIASDRPGSGNTKNIGSTTYLERLINGTGIFAQLGIAVFDDYWMRYHTREMARQAELSQAPYYNLITYQAYKQQATQILNIPQADLLSEDASEDEQEP
jgi:hypothetical protein